MLVVTFFQLQIHQSVIFLFPVFCLEVQFQANFCSFEGNLSFFLLVTLKSVCFSLLCLFLPPFFFKCAYIWFSFYSSLSVCKIEDFWYNVFFFFFDSSKRVPHSVSWVHSILLQRYTIVFFFYVPLV